ncbi:hypothetical protein ON010_g15127 [Phytophthora cinnamomi]|nr:hypothetical protein ON010_g15127 [Phytophthora cinnamomi]
MHRAGSETLRATTASKSLAYEGESYSTTALDQASEAAQEAYRRVQGQLSGTALIGSTCVQTGGSLIPHTSSENDSIVERQRYADGLSTSEFGNTYDDTFNLTGLNHADTTFRLGDSLIVNSQKPVKWFECLL